MEVPGLEINSSLSPHTPLLAGPWPYVRGLSLSSFVAPLLNWSPELLESAPSFYAETLLYFVLAV